MEEDCIICYDKKCTFIEKYFFNKIKIHSLDYPIIPFSHAYGCSCKTTFAHNNCLKTIKQCPLCRKLVEKPNLHVEVYFEKYLITIKDNIIIVMNRSVYACILVYIFLIMLILKKYIYINNFYVIMLFHICYTYILFIAYSWQFIKLYWLYDEKLNKFFH